MLQLKKPLQRAWNYRQFFVCFEKSIERSLPKPLRSLKSGSNPASYSNMGLLHFPSAHKQPNHSTDPWIAPKGREKHRREFTA